jgi:hypothetical protein
MAKAGSSTHGQQNTETNASQILERILQGKQHTASHILVWFRGRLLGKVFKAGEAWRLHSAKNWTNVEGRTLKGLKVGYVPAWFTAMLFEINGILSAFEC